MRACWLKWVGRDWSISADYIWLNYSDANIFLTALFLIPFAPVYLLPVFYVLQTVAYSLFAPIKYSIFQNAADSSIRCSLISVQSQMVAVGAILFYLFNAALSNIVGIRVVLLIALGISSLVYIPALFRLTSQRP